MRNSALAAIFALILGGSTAALAQPVSSNPEDADFRINFGGFFTSFDNSISVGPKTGGTPGTDFDLERDLGLGNQTSFRVDGFYRFGPHGRLAFGYRGWKRSSDHTIDRQIDFGDLTYDIGATVNFQQTVRIFDVYYGYSFVHTPEFEIGPMLGVSAASMTTSLDATGSVTGPEGPVSGSSTHQEKSLLAPLPALGAFVSWRPMATMDVHAEVKGLPTITIDNYSGSLLDFRVGGDYFFTENVGLGVNYNYVKYTFSREVKQLVMLSYRYSGPSAYIAIAF